LSEILSPHLLISSITIFLNTAFGCSEKLLVGAETRVRGKAVGSPRSIVNEIRLTPIYELANKAAIEHYCEKLTAHVGGVIAMVY
jgi:hypothetical protein